MITALAVEVSYRNPDDTYTTPVRFVSIDGGPAQIVGLTENGAFYGEVITRPGISNATDTYYPQDGPPFLDALAYYFRGPGTVARGPFEMDAEEALKGYSPHQPEVTDGNP